MGTTEIVKGFTKMMFRGPILDLGRQNQSLQLKTGWQLLFKKMLLLVEYPL